MIPEKVPSLEEAKEILEKAQKSCTTGVIYWLSRDGGEAWEFKGGLLVGRRSCESQEIMERIAVPETLQ